MTDDLINKYREETTSLRQQVTLLRTVMNRIAFSRTGQCVSLTQELFAREKWAAEALDKINDLKKQETPQFRGPYVAKEQGK